MTLFKRALKSLFLRPFLMIASAAVVLCPSFAMANGVQAIFSLDTPGGGPFPSDRFTVPDATHLTGLRVNLPQSNCANQVSDCLDIAVLNTLDGFSLQPRMSIPFTGPINVGTVNSTNVFLIRDNNSKFGSAKVIGINEIVWDPAANVLHVESDEFLEQHTRYVLIVTRGIRDGSGDPVEVGAFSQFRRDLNFGHTKDSRLKEYRKSLLDSLELARAVGIAEEDIVSASVFTTQSATAILEKIRNQIKSVVPPPASFDLGPGSSTTVFPVSAITGIDKKEQRNTISPLTTVVVPLSLLKAFPGVEAVAFGKYASPDYETTGKFIPAVGTRTGVPAIQAVNDIYFNLFVPVGTPPSGGWPVAIFGHGLGNSKDSAAFAVASTMGANGIATLAINAVGHGRGPLSTLTVNRTAGGPVTFSAGGRGIDQDGNTSIDTFEGLSAAPPNAQTVAYRDGLRQTAIDLMQLTRVIETGGIPGLDGTRIYYFGQSLGGIYGTIFLGVEPSIRAGVPSVPGGSLFTVARLAPAFRPLVGQLLGTRVPSLINIGGIFFNENLPLRNQPPVINTVPGAIAIQKMIDNGEWTGQAGDPVAYAPHLRRDPLEGMSSKPIIIQFAKGDQTVPNPAASALLRAGDLADRATYFRNDLAFALNPATPKNPHGFLSSITVPSVSAYAFEAQAQVAAFFLSEGATTIDPDGVGPIFETPVAGPLPEELNFIP